MPCADANGLLPGLGIPVRGVFSGAGAGAGFSAFGSLFTGSEGASTSTVSVLAFDLVVLAAAFLGAGFSALGKAARNFAATGGAMVEDPPFTYSPSSSNLASATLVSMPSSLAMSYTRGSANYFLLSGANPKQGRPYC